MDLDLVLRRAIESTCVIGRVPKNDSMQNRFERFKLKFFPSDVPSRVAGEWRIPKPASRVCARDPA
jgi:hypothetical protein